MNDMTSIKTTTIITTITADDGSTCQTIFDFAGTPIDIIRMNGKVWLSAPAVLAAMGFPDDGKNTNRSLQRVQPVDIIKATSTPFRFTDGRRNASSFISPRAVMMFAQQGGKGMDPIKANAVVEWMRDEVLHGQEPNELSPWEDMEMVEKMESLPTFHAGLALRHIRKREEKRVRAEMKRAARRSGYSAIEERAIQWLAQNPDPLPLSPPFIPVPQPENTPH